MTVKYGLVVPTRIEAAEIISDNFYHWQKQENIYYNDSLKLVISGIGKANACFHLHKVFDAEKIILFGTAGSLKGLTPGTIYSSYRFIENDFDLSAAQPAFTKQIIETTPAHSLSLTGLAISSDKILDKISEAGDTIDMESAAIAKICHQYNKPFSYICYITDSNQKDTIPDWPKNAKLAAVEFNKILKTIL